MVSAILATQFFTHYRDVTLDVRFDVPFHHRRCAALNASTGRRLACKICSDRPSVSRPAAFLHTVVPYTKSFISHTDGSRLHMTTRIQNMHPVSVRTVVTDAKGHRVRAPHGVSRAIPYRKTLASSLVRRGLHCRLTLHLEKAGLFPFATCTSRPSSM